MKLRSQAFQGTNSAARAVGIPGIHAGENVKPKSSSAAVAEFKTDGAGCHYCGMAKTRADWPMYFSTCKGCRIRMLAGGIAFFNSRKEGRLLPMYQQTLQETFGDGWRAAHDEVKAEYERIQKLREGVSRG